MELENLQNNPELQQSNEQALPDQVMIIDGVHVDMANYFDVYPVNLNTREKEQLRYIYENAPGNSIAEKMRYIADIELALGQPSDGTRYGKIWGWMKTKQAIRI